MCGGNAKCRSVYWTDSTTILQMIHNETKWFPIFVASRMAVIIESIEIKSWKYMPSKMNPADFAMPGISANQLSAMHLWLIGPNFFGSQLRNGQKILASCLTFLQAWLKSRNKKQKTTVFRTESNSQNLAGEVFTD